MLPRPVFTGESHLELASKLRYVPLGKRLATWTSTILVVACVLFPRGVSFLVIVGKGRLGKCCEKYNKDGLI